MTDRKRFDLRGAVKHCEMQRTWYSRGCGPDACESEERTDRTVLEFRPDGSLERHWYKNPPPDSSEWTHFYEYNDLGQLTVVHGEMAGNIKPIRIYEYNSSGRISRLLMPDKDGNLRVAETYEYDSDGRMKKITHIEQELRSEACGPQGCGTMYGLDGTVTAYAAPGTSTITSIYDEHGRPTEHLLNDPTGELIMQVDFTYDDRGNLVEEVTSQLKLPPELTAQFNPQQLKSIQSMFRHRELHQYDAHNRRIERTSPLGPDGFHRDTFAYDDHGNMISQISEVSNSEYEVAEDGRLTAKEDGARSHRSESRLRYQYDPFGNWTEKITESPDGQIWGIERRTITYYDVGCS